MPLDHCPQNKHRLTVEIFNDSLAIILPVSSDFVSPDLVMVTTWPPSNQSPSMLLKITISWIASTSMAGIFSFWWGILTWRTMSLKTAQKLWTRLLDSCLSQTFWPVWLFDEDTASGWRLLSFLEWRGMPSKNGTTTKKRHTRNCKNWRCDLASRQHTDLRFAKSSS